MTQDQPKIYDIIIKTEFSKYLSDTTIYELCKIMNIVDYKKNTTIYSKNEKITKFLIVNSGECKLINNSTLIRKLYKNDFFWTH